jgi:hypothetical protein
MKEYAKKVVPNHTALSEKLHCPGIVLPGVTIPDDAWESVSSATKKAVYDYLSILDLASIYSSGAGGAGFSKEWAENIMKDWRSRMDKVDFESLSDKFKTIFGGDGALPKLPEKFLKGQLAKLAEEIVRDIKPEDLGLTPEVMAECEKSPSRAFDLLVQLFTKNPDKIQGMIKRIGKRLQQKVQSGAIRPQEIAKEAEELMKEFAGNADLVGMMESLKGAFGFEDMDMARQAGREGSARLSAVRERLKKKLDAKKNGTDNKKK